MRMCSILGLFQQERTPLDLPRQKLISEQAHNTLSKDERWCLENTSLG